MKLRWTLASVFALASAHCGGGNNTHDTGAVDGAGGDTQPIVDASDASDATPSDAPDVTTADVQDATPGDTGADGATHTGSCPADDATHFSVCGTATFDWIPAKDDITEGGVRLDYSASAPHPARRVLVEATSGGATVASSVTDDAGHFALAIPSGMSVTLQLSARMLTNGTYASDGIAPDRCNGGSWDIRVVDNTNAGSLYVVQGTDTFNAHTENATLRAATTYGTNAYTSRAGAPFAILDTIVNVLELVCQAAPATVFPPVVINWSVNNAPTDGDVTMGMIGTSHYDSNAVALFILGKEDVDTDEYDDHVIAHEFGHYLEHQLFRADNIGGSHSDNDVLDPRVAFGEGYGNAISGMAFQDPIYVDTSGVGQASGSSTPVNLPPMGDDRGVYSEASVQYFLWSLFDNRDPAPNVGNFDRIYQILASGHRTTPGFTTVQTFAAYYNAQFGGAAESLQSLWSTDLDTPYASLCAGMCTGTGDTADVFDTDDDLGVHYGAGPSMRNYPESTGMPYPAEFWQLYRPIVSGDNAPTAHDQTLLGMYSSPHNKLGAERWYQLTGSGQSTTVSVAQLGASDCNTDVLDMDVFHVGANVGSDESNSGCPTVTFDTVAGDTYLVVVDSPPANTIEIPSWHIVVSP